MVLVDLCLKAFIGVFDKYYEAYKTSQDVKLKRNFEFLLRVYTSKVASLLDRQHLMKKEYIDVLINKYMKVLDTIWFCCPLKDITSRLITARPDILQVSFHEYSEEILWKDVFSCLPNLRVMFFRGHCQDEILRCVSKFCPNLREIVLNFSQDVREGFKYLYSGENKKVPLPHLKKLTVYKCNIDHETAVNLIENLPSLEVYEHEMVAKVLYDIYRNDLLAHGKVMKSYNLISLNFFEGGRNMEFEQFKSCIALCPNLKILRCPVYNQEYLDCICTLPNLEELQIDSVPSYQPFVFSSMLMVKSLKLLGFCISVLFLAARCPALKFLSLSRTEFQNFHESEAVFHNLEEFHFYARSKYDVETHKSLDFIFSSSPKLEIIHFFVWSTPLTAEQRSELQEWFQCRPRKNIQFISY